MTSPIPHIWAIVPAAGRGRRFREASTDPTSAPPAERCGTGVPPVGCDTGVPPVGCGTGVPPVQGQCAAGPRRARSSRVSPVHPADHPAAYKQLTRLGPRSMLAAVLDVLEASRLAGVVAVVNAAIAPAIQAERPPGPRRVYAFNPNPDGEMIESIQIGLATAGTLTADRDTTQSRDRKGAEEGGSIPAANLGVTDQRTGQPAQGPLKYGARAEGYLICPGDHPAVTVRSVDLCLAAFAASTGSIVLAVHEGRRGHPLIVPADLAAVVASWPSTARLSELRTRFADRVLEVETGEPGVLIDVDRPEDLAGFG